MFEDLNAHRAAVAENIEKAMEIGFTGSEDLEKAHQVGDVHPNGKWVWTQLPSGKYDWRVKKQGQEGKPAAQAKSGKEEKPEKKEAKGGSGDASKFMDALTVYNNKYNDESKVAVMKTEKGNWDTYYDGHRLGVISGSVLDEKVAEEKGWVVSPDGDARAHSKGETAAQEMDKILKPLDKWSDDDWNDEKKNTELTNKIKAVVVKYDVSKKDFDKIASKYKGLDLNYNDYVSRDKVLPTAKKEIQTQLAKFDKFTDKDWNDGKKQDEIVKKIRGLISKYNVTKEEWKEIAKPYAEGLSGAPYEDFK